MYIYKSEGETNISFSIDFMGGLGFSCEYPQEKFFRDCKVGKKHFSKKNCKLPNE
jgi:alkylation response protein AidB-like acyl-CoA dehydrogenase